MWDPILQQFGVPLSMVMRELEASLPLAGHPKGEAQWTGDKHVIGQS